MFCCVNFAKNISSKQSNISLVIKLNFTKMYKVNRYKFISELHRKVTRLSVNSYHTSNIRENNVTSFLALPQKITLLDHNKTDLKRINREYSAILKLFSRSFSIPEYSLIRSLSSSILNCQQNKEGNKVNRNDRPPSYKPGIKHDNFAKKIKYFLKQYYSHSRWKI